MKDILILSNFFPPTKLTPSERVYSWAKYFKQFGLYPIIITRIWPDDTSGYHSAIKNAGSEIIVKKFEEYEVHYLPYRSDLNERLSLKWGNSKLHFLYRIVLFLNYFLEPLFLFRIAPYYRKLLNYTTTILKERAISKVLITAAPFMLFKVGYKLKKRFSNIAVYADYRDDWTTSDICFNPNNVRALEWVRSYLKYFEKKWLSSYKLFFTVSENYVEKIHNLIKIPGYVAENGFMSENYTNHKIQLKQKFTFTYIGYIYGTQPIEIFLNCVQKMILEENIDLHINFIGLKDQSVQYERIRNASLKISEYITFTERLNKQDCIKIQQESHVLLQVGHKGIKGSPGSKMYEYLALKKPILVCPSDGDIVEETLTNSGQAFIANDEIECYNRIKELISLYNNNTPFSFNDDFINQFDRKFIAGKMVDKMLN